MLWPLSSFLSGAKKSSELHETSCCEEVYSFAGLSFHCTRVVRGTAVVAPAKPWLTGRKGFQMDRGRGRSEAFDHWMNIHNWRPRPAACADFRTDRSPGGDGKKLRNLSFLGSDVLLLPHLAAALVRHVLDFPQSTSLDSLRNAL